MCAVYALLKDTTTKVQNTSNMCSTGGRQVETGKAAAVPDDYPCW
jgi:hypothetical protein